MKNLKITIDKLKNFIIKNKKILLIATVLIIFAILIFLIITYRLPKEQAPELLQLPEQVPALPISEEALKQLEELERLRGDVPPLTEEEAQRQLEELERLRLQR